MNKKYVIGVVLGGTKICTALVDLEGNIIEKIEIKTEADKGSEAILNNIINTIDKVSDKIDFECVKSIGIGSPGPLDTKKGVILYTPNLPFRNFNLLEPIRKRYKVDTYLDNDANVATLGEYMFGAGKGTKNMVYITVSTGIGGGAIINGNLFRGSTGNALEIGHMMLVKDGPRCGCGNLGCAEAMASGTAISKVAHDMVESDVITTLKNYENLTTKDVFIEAEKGDFIANKIINNSLEYLGIAVANIANIFDPEIIVIGGGVSNGGSIVFNIINKEMEKRALKTIKDNCVIKKAALDGKSGVLGAAALAILAS